MAQVYAAKYLAKAAMSAPRDLVRSAVAKYTPLHPTVFIFHCTFVCDARCEMCSNWTRGNRKEDMTLAQIEGSEEHTSELQSRLHLVCRLLLEKKKKKNKETNYMQQKEN